MNVLTDTNSGLRWAKGGTPEGTAVAVAMEVLLARGDQLVMASQNFVEFWSVVTRPIEVNGLALDLEHAERLLAHLESVFDLLPEPPTVHAIWRQLVLAHRVRGRQVHDARLAAVMLANGVSHILTFNVADFARYPGIVAIDPRDLAGVAP